MDLLDRYLGVIRWQLPAKTRDDITAELRDTLLNRFEEKESELGRPLLEVEQEDILRAFGHPILVAGRYRPRQHLIGPRILPLYELSVKAAAAIILAVNAVKLGLGLFSGQNAGQAIVQFMGGTIEAAFYILGVLTAAAVAIELSKARFARLENWRARDLPEFPKRRHASPWERMLELGLAVLFILVWMGAWPVPLEWSQVVEGRLMRVAPGPIWFQQHTAITAMLIVQALPLLLRVAQPSRVRLALALEAVGQFLGAAIMFVIVQAPPWFLVTVDGSSTHPTAARLSGIIELSLRYSLWGAVALSLLMAGIALWRLARQRSR